MRWLWVMMAVFMSVGCVMYAADFADIDAHIYEDDIMYIASEWVVQGYPDGTFWPDRSITRAEITKIVIEGVAWLQAEQSGSWCFPDVSTDARYAEYVCIAQSEHIVKGYPDGTFQPEKKVTIAEWLKIALETFDMTMDRGQYDYRYQPYLERVIANGLRERYALNPYAEMTRGEMSYLVARLMRIQNGEINEVISSHLSPGCDLRSQPSTAPTIFVADGLTRSTITVVGSQYRQSRPTALIIAYHGRTGTPEEIRQYMKIEKIWDQDGIIVYPRRWSFGTREVERDGAFFDQILSDIGEQYCIDYNHIYVIGHSLGAYFTHALSCSRGDVIRASGSVGGSTANISCTGPAAGVIIHNPNDTLAGFSWGEWARDQRLAVNGCDPDIFEPYRTPTNANCVIYDQCETELVVRCPHTEDYARWDRSYYPHTWPSFATSVIRDFWEELD